MKIGVIGGGIGGLAVACLLAKEGHEVTVWEKNASLGGRARVWDKDGFRFDMGPSWYLMPKVYKDFFGLFNKSVSDFYELKRLDPGYKVWLENREVSIKASLKENFGLFDELEKAGGEKLSRYLDYARRQYEYSEKSGAMMTSLDSIRNIFSKDFLRYGRKVELRRSFWSVLSEYFESEEARMVAAYAVIFLGAVGVAPAPGVAEPKMGKYPERGGFGVTVGSCDNDEDVVGVKFGVFDLDVEVGVGVKNFGVAEFVFGLIEIPEAVFVVELFVGEGGLGIFVEHLHVTVGWGVVEVEVVFFNVFAVVALRVGESEEAFFEDGILAVPEGRGEAEILAGVGDASDAIFSPAVGATTRLVVGKTVPEVLSRVVFAEGSPGTVGEIWAPLEPFGLILETLEFFEHRQLRIHYRRKLVQEARSVRSD